MKAKVQKIGLVCLAGLALLAVRAEAISYFTQTAGDWTNTLNWNGGVPIAGTDTRIGTTSYASPATATVNAGDNAVCGSLKVGYGAGKVGTLNLTGGICDPGGAIVELANNTGLTGIVYMTGGVLTNTAVQVGALAGSGYGELNISGSSVFYGSSAVQSKFGNTGSIGILNQTGGDLRAASGTHSIFLGYATNGRGVYNVSGGTLSSIALRVGYLGGGLGELNISGSAYLQPADFYVGQNGTGVVTQTSGTVSAGTINLANVAGSVGTYTISGGSITNVDVRTGAGNGTMNISGNATLVGKSGGQTQLGGGNSVTGTVNQSGGFWNVNQLIYIGQVAGSLGVYNISGGTVSNATSLRVGRTAGARGEMTISGNALVTSLGDFYIADQAGTTGLVTQTGGTVDVSGITFNVGFAGIGRYTQSNGVFRAKSVTLGANFGSVELWGTNRVFEVGNILTVNAGTTITNHVQGYSGGLDITNSAAGGVAMNAAGRIHVAFDQDPKVAGKYWGLRWAGDHTNLFATWLGDGRLTVSTNALSSYWQPKVGLFYDGTNSFVGMQVNDVSHGTLLMFE